MRDFRETSALAIPETQPGQVFDAVCNCGHFQSLQPPTDAVQCPICGGTRGYPVRNYCEDSAKVAWSCREHDCIRKNCPPPLFRQPIRRIRPEAECNLEECGVPPACQGATLSNCWQPPKLIWAMEEYAKKGTRPMLIYGPNGTGKTYAAAAIMHRFITCKKRPARFWKVSDLHAEFSRSGIEPVRWSNLEMAIADAPLLVLDDMGIRVPTEAFLDALYRIVDARCSAMRPTIVTTNLNGSEFAQRFDRAIVSRLTSGYKVQIKGHDKRYVDGNRKPVTGKTGV